MTETEQVFSEIYDMYKQDPVFFAEHCCGYYTHKKMREILRSVRDNERTIVHACHGSSKTFTSAIATTWFIEMNDDARVITTAPTNDQVEKLLWKEINRIYQTARFELSGECLVKEIKFKIEGGNATHFAYGFSTDKPARAEGHHAKKILYIFDEAKGIPQWMWDAAEGALTGTHCRWLVVSTTDGAQPGEKFFDIIDKGYENWNIIHIDAYDLPSCTGENYRYIYMPDILRPDIFERRYLESKEYEYEIPISDKKWINEKADPRTGWGEHNPLFLTKVRGQLSDMISDTIIKRAQIQQMFDNWENGKYNEDGKEAIGVDSAWGGGDDCAFFKVKGLTAQKYQIIPSKEMPLEKKHFYVAEKLAKFAEFDKKIPAKGHKGIPLRIDATGVGSGLVDIMQQWGYNVIPIAFNQHAVKRDLYADAISEMWYTVANKISLLACPRIPRLERELANRKSGGMTGSGQQKIESKKDYKTRTSSVSPDLVDAFLLANYHEIDEIKGNAYFGGLEDV